MATDWRIEPVPALRGYAVEWLEPGRVFLSKKNRIYLASTPTGQREMVGEIDAPAWKRLVSRARWAQRLFRFMAYNVIPLAGDELFITFEKRIGLLSNGRFRPLQGLNRPCRVLRRGCAMGPHGSVIWGEYLSNVDREAISIYRYAPGSARMEVLYTFTAGEILHVHGIYAEPDSGALWCVTGDRPEECKILRTGDLFENVEIVGEGDETWRTVSLLFTDNAVFYASDAEFRPNYIYRLDRRTGERTTLAQVDGPVYYSHALGKDLFFATTAELCSSQDQPVASLWHVAPSGEVKRVCSFTKDSLHTRLAARLLMHGTLHFPLGPGLEKETYISGVGLRGLDNRVVRLCQS